MPKNPHTIQFSLPSEQLQKLEALAVNGESVGLVAKRLVLEALGSPLEKAVYKHQLDDLQERIEAIERRLSIDTVDNLTSKTDDEKNLVKNLFEGDRAVALQNKFCVVSQNGEKQIEKFWSGREFCTDLSKAKIFESERGAATSVKTLKSKGYKSVAWNSCDRIYEMLDDSDKKIASLYWLD